MKTPLPTPGKWLHERCGQKVYTESQLRAAMVAAYNEGVEDAAKHTQELVGWIGVCDAANEIRKLKEQTQ